MSQDYPKRLYAVLHPSPALIGSQMNPQSFARHYLSGSVRHYSGKVIFAEIDSSFRHPYFPIDHFMDNVHAHEDGRPKATKYISVYRVLEHLDFSMIKALYLTSPEAVVLRLEEQEEINTRDNQEVLRIFAEINPVRMLVLSRLSFVEFGQLVTNPELKRNVPAMFYTQLEFDANDFLQEFELNPLLPPMVPKLHPSKLRDAILELSTKPDKVSKGMLLDSSFDEIPYRLVRHGFMFARHGEYKFFGMPPIEDIRRDNHKFWIAM
ncbi:MAG: hypothetical protein K9L68_14560 [Spirochaetales bacterium]|nr:hypothetical protein [Spirochaetales bacterium]MCF7939811.1 hypothetical protein [Spirochaetales bacterium]